MNTYPGYCRLNSHVTSKHPLLHYYFAHLLHAKGAGLIGDIVGDHHHLAALGVLGGAHHDVPGQHADLVGAHHAEILRQGPVGLHQKLLGVEQLGGKAIQKQEGWEGGGGASQPRKRNPKSVHLFLCYNKMNALFSKGRGRASPFPPALALMS